jgi:hypothetical protein
MHIETVCVWITATPPMSGKPSEYTTRRYDPADHIPSMAVSIDHYEVPWKFLYWQPTENNATGILLVCGRRLTFHKDLLTAATAVLEQSLPDRPPDGAGDVSEQGLVIGWSSSGLHVDTPEETKAEILRLLGTVEAPP